jgi:hypothetical protein
MYTKNRIFSHEVLPTLFHNNPERICKRFSGRSASEELQTIWRIASKGDPLENSQKLPTFILKEIDQWSLILFTMPFTSYPPDALYICCAFYDGDNNVHQSHRYFTLERGYHDDPANDTPVWFFCEWESKEKHLNYGKLPDSDVNTFIKAVCDGLEIAPFAPKLL